MPSPPMISMERIRSSMSFSPPGRPSMKLQGSSGGSEPVQPQAEAASIRSLIRFNSPASGYPCSIQPGTLPALWMSMPSAPIWAAKRRYSSDRSDCRRRIFTIPSFPGFRGTAAKGYVNDAAANTRHAAEGSPGSPAPGPVCDSGDTCVGIRCRGEMPRPRGGDWSVTSCKKKILPAVVGEDLGAAPELPCRSQPIRKESETFTPKGDCDMKTARALSPGAPACSWPFC